MELGTQKQMKPNGSIGFDSNSNIICFTLRYLYTKIGLFKPHNYYLDLIFLQCLKSNILNSALKCMSQKASKRPNFV